MNRDRLRQTMLIAGCGMPASVVASLIDACSEKRKVVLCGSTIPTEKEEMIMPNAPQLMTTAIRFKEVKHAHLCPGGCGKRVSANKIACWNCLESKVRQDDPVFELGTGEANFRLDQANRDV